MNRPLVFRRAARAEFADAGDWYEQRSNGLGAKFTYAVDKVLAKIVARPDFYPIIEGDVREAMVPGFPYCVYYRVEPTQIVIIAVFHTSRDPSTWRGRI